MLDTMKTVRIHYSQLLETLAILSSTASVTTDTAEHDYLHKLMHALLDTKSAGDMYIIELKQEECFGVWCALQTYGFFLTETSQPEADKIKNTTIMQIFAGK